MAQSAEPERLECHFALPESTRLGVISGARAKNRNGS